MSLWSTNERVHPLSIRTLIGKEARDGAEMERTSWRVLGEKVEKALINGGPESSFEPQHREVLILPMLPTLFPSLPTRFG